MTTYDDVYEIFDTLAWGIDEYSLPQTEQGKYRLIKLAVMKYNQRLNLRDDERLDCSDTTESFNKSLASEHINLVAHYMKESVLSSMVDEILAMIPVASKDQAIKNYKDVVAQRMEWLKNERQEIYNIAIALSDYSELEEVSDL